MSFQPNEGRLALSRNYYKIRIILQDGIEAPSGLVPTYKYGEVKTDKETCKDC